MVEDDVSESLLNIVLDAIEDIIMILDTDHTIVWINRAGLNAFGASLDESIGKRCFKMFGRISPCEDCDIWVDSSGAVRSKRIKIIPRTGKEYVCTSTPLYKEGKVTMFVQHLSEVKDGIVN